MRVRLGVVLLGLRPSLRWLRGSLIFFVRQLHRYYGAVRLLQNVHARIMDLSLPGRSARADALEVSRFSSTLFPDVPGLFDYAEPDGHSRSNAARWCCLPTDRKGSALGFRFSELNHPARQFLCLRFAAIPREITGKTRGQNGVASPFLWGSFIPYNVPVYPGALCPRNSPRNIPVPETSLSPKHPRNIPETLKLVLKLSCKSVSETGTTMH